MAKRIGSLEGKIETVELSMLQVHRISEDPVNGYQRDLKPHRKHMRQNWNPAAAGMLTVARRGDDLYIIDGQQRWNVMLDLNIAKWKALVIHSSGPQYEATIFQLINASTGRKSLSALDLFYASLVAKDPVAEACLRAVTASGLQLKPYHGSGAKTETTICCVARLYKLTSKYGEENVRNGLKLMTTTWPMQIETMGDVFPYACIMLVATQGETLDQAHFAEVMSKIPPRKILLDTAIAQGSRKNNGLEIITKLYNRKTRAKTKKLKLLSEDTDGSDASVNEDVG